MGFKGVFKFFLRRLVEILVFVLLVLFMPNLPPKAKIQDPYTVTRPKPFQGKLALNERLNNAEIWHKGDLSGPEAFADFDGDLYTTLNGGDVVKLTGEHVTPVVKFGKPCKGLYQEKICGRPLGMGFVSDGTLIVADAYYGIFAVDVKTGDKVKLVSLDAEIDGRKPKISNSVAVARNGDIYWSDSSTEFSLEDGVFDLLSDGSGRLIHYNARTKQNKVLLNNLLFANGVALSEDEDFVVVSETGKNRLHRCFLKGTDQGRCEVFVDGLPGLPDNLKADGRGGFLVPLIVPVDKDHPSASQILGPFPLIRKFLARTLGVFELAFKLTGQVYQNQYSEKAVHFIGHFQSLTFAHGTHRLSVIHVSKTGEIIDSFHALDGKISHISEVHIFRDYLYLGSPFNDYIARVPLQKVGLSYLVKPQVQQTTAPPTTAAPSKPTTQVPLSTTTTRPPSTTRPPTTTTQPPTTTTQPPTTTRPPTTTQPPTTKQAPPVTRQAPSPSTTPKPVVTESPQKPKVVPVKEVPPSPPVKASPPPVKVPPSPTKEATPQPPAAPIRQAEPKQSPPPPSQAKVSKDNSKGVPKTEL